MTLDLASQVSRRRTFAVISHPDAGKTTLTEKLLLYGGAIHLAGSVKGAKGRRAVTSDWMEIERQRGISITTSVLQFEYLGRQMNLLDTPGHNDFSEDTYRTLAAVDSAVMLIDGVKGIEPQTIKLFQVCRMRGIPIVTFVNKLDRAGRPPLDLLDEIERVLGIPCSAMNWPVGSGTSFLGVYDREARHVLRFERVEGGASLAPMTACPLDDPEIAEIIGTRAHAELQDELALLDTAGHPFDEERYLAGQLSPVFFGSAMTNFGVEPFLNRFVELAPSPRGRVTSVGPVTPASEQLSGFVFKIQANMDPRHRDRIAFICLCSGKFVRGMDVQHVRTGKPFPMTRTVQFLGQERQTIEEAYAGDIVGVWDGGTLRIGDTVVGPGPAFEFEGVPRFSPEHFVIVTLKDPMKRKQLKAGLEQLSDEGAVQMFFDRHRLQRDPILGAVGLLQFEILQHRLASEYSVKVALQPLPYHYARWVEGEFDPEKFDRPGSSACVVDAEDRKLLLFETEWGLNWAIQHNPELKFIAAVQPGRAGNRMAA